MKIMDLCANIIHFLSIVLRLKNLTANIIKMAVSYRNVTEKNIFHFIKTSSIVYQISMAGKKHSLSKN